VTRLLPAGLVAALAVLYALLFVGAVTTTVGLVFWCALATYLLDLPLTALADPRLTGGLNAVGAGLPWRVFIRQALVVVFLAQADVLSDTAVGVTLGALVAHHLAYGLFAALRAAVRSRRLRRLETRNLDVPGSELPPPPPAWLIDNGASVVLRTDLLLIAALGVAWADGSYRLVAGAAVATAVLALPFALMLAPRLLALLRLPDDEERLLAAHRAVDTLAPLVILHFSGGISSVYQVNMWLRTMERLERPVLVLLRERRYLDQVAPTTAPVLCLPFSADLMNFPMPSAKVALYVANVGRNIHLLREPGLKSAFIGHGDSDKTASFNPATKVYDEVWVAGEAGRQRYVRAQVGVREDEIVLVGRPQLDGIEEAGPRPAGAPFTVLYAPTWESWVDDPFATSVISLGPTIVRTLLATPGVRVIYKPHPLTGTVNPLATVASDEIVAAITAAGGQHVAVLDNARPLYDLFNESDALVSDISSVVSDYLRSNKPYFVTNLPGLPDEVFRDVNPSAGAAYLIGPDGDGLVAGLASARGADELRARRREVRTYLIGDPALDPMTLFRQAVDDLAARADRMRAALPG
jgi:CDP-Glycerol:Poly(glycerophosphate) glycerophosphotransferase